MKYTIMHYFDTYKTHYMKTYPALLPKNIRILKLLGEQIQIARLRRRLSTEQMAERTGISRKTVYNIE